MTALPFLLTFRVERPSQRSLALQAKLYRLRLSEARQHGVGFLLVAGHGSVESGAILQKMEPQFFLAQAAVALAGPSSRLTLDL